jgi:CspA family cold shock protein
MSETRIQGTVRWFSRGKGYGFITPDGQEKDVFVHFSAIRGEGYRNLEGGQRVEFSIEDTPKGPQAIEVAGLLDTGEDAFEEIPEEPQAMDVPSLLDTGEDAFEEIPEEPQAMDVPSLLDSGEEFVD